MRREKKIKKKIGVFGGTFDPPHKGHLQIANFSLKKLKLDYLIWAITKRNPFKKKPMLSLKSRVFLSKKFIKNNKRIKIKNYDKYLKSNKTIDLLKFLKEKNKRTKFYFIMGSDNLIKFHKWDSWSRFQDLCSIVIFPRQGYLKKTLACKAYKLLRKEKIIFLKSKIANISSSKIRKNYLV
tara:strand:- start:3802 stop:4344 length:543 start_codon:yes stop_codon:yes gene_type:complete